VHSKKWKPWVRHLRHTVSKRYSYKSSQANSTASVQCTDRTHFVLLSYVLDKCFRELDGVFRVSAASSHREMAISLVR
jgi:hypothetical protein